ncbi:MAG: cytochrome C oxidase subunit II [Flavobacterium sp. BFFFF2]|nr:MAG: cytochrome C oxidase subunit II [Flavobacterium sp. BFFFF2]
MTSLLVLIIVLLLGIALWQLTKIFDLSQIGSNADNTQIATDNDNKVNGYLMFAFLVFIYLFTIYSMYKWGHLVLGQAASAHGDEYDNLMYISMALIFVVQIITQALLHYFTFKYAGKKGQQALYFSDNNKLEIIWSSIPAVVLAGLILYGLYTWNDIMFLGKEEEEDSIVVELYAQQFKWEVRYSGHDNVLGKANVRYIEGVNNLGVDLQDPNAQDDFTSSELHLPKGKRVIFKIRSQDVLHSAYFPHFRAQMNCVPGMVTNFSFIPTITTAEMRDNSEIIEKINHINQLREAKSKILVASGKPALEPYTFDYLLLCNKICGASHYNMQMKVVIDTPAEFNKWLKDKQSIVSAVAKAKADEAAEKEAAEKALAPVNDLKMDTVTLKEQTLQVSQVVKK